MSKSIFIKNKLNVKMIKFQKIKSISKNYKPK